MKRKTAAILLAGGLVALFAWVPVTRSLAWRRDYVKAESLVQTIWPMAREMQRFSEERGRPPDGLDELAAFLPDDDLKPLRDYPSEFHLIGPRRFFLRVNSRFAFVIDDQFTPSWWRPAGVFADPENPAFR